MQDREGHNASWRRTVRQQRRIKLSDSAVAGKVAERILQGFEFYQKQFWEVTLQARSRFLSRNWGHVQSASAQRIRLYNSIKNAVCAEVSAEALSLDDWRSVRRIYWAAVSERRDRERATTFYNSVYRRSHQRAHLHDDYAFVSALPAATSPPAVVLTRTLHGVQFGDVVRQALSGCDIAEDLADIDDDVRRMSSRLAARIPLLRERHELVLELLTSVFYRNKGAYLIGKLSIDEHLIPVAIAMTHGTEGIRVDAFLWGESRLSVLFSFTRSYFMVDAEDPMQVVEYLQGLLPAKKKWELLTSIGYFKHGKTEFVRGYRQHLDHSEDLFVEAEGIRGQVMMVFGLASYQTVFKVMKDRFPATKSVTHDDVRRAYQLVKSHDRVGRMADTQEFHVFEFPRNRFDPGLLEELLRYCAASVKVEADKVVISHLYTERMMTPLNLYIQRCGDFELSQVIDDYGYAIKDLAAANIFPGDMLLKNFGVTRHGRVVFYDYDEICYLTDVNFRTMPGRQDGNAMGQAEAWFDVGEYDVFPEEFATFLFPDDDMQNRFRRHHADLFTAEGWQEIQTQVREGRISDVYPYPQQERLHLGDCN